MTMQGARLAIFCETLPSSSPARRPRLRRPMTTTSAFSRCAIFDYHLGGLARASMKFDLRRANLHRPFFD